MALPKETCSQFAASTHRNAFVLSSCVNLARRGASSRVGIKKGFVDDDLAPVHPHTSRRITRLMASESRLDTMFTSLLFEEAYACFKRTYLKHVRLPRTKGTMSLTRAKQSCLARRSVVELFRSYGRTGWKCCFG